jgi:hypothetical protein
MPISEEEFASIKTMIDAAIGEIGQTFITGEVIKRDEVRKLVWIKELGDQPIPVVGFQRTVDVYSPSAASSLQSARAHSSAAALTFSAADAARRTYLPAVTQDWNTIGGTPFSTNAFTAPFAGTYLVGLSLDQFSAAGTCEIIQLKNDATILKAVSQTFALGTDAGNKAGVENWTLSDLLAGDFLKMHGFHTGGGTCALTWEAIRLDTSSQIQKRIENSNFVIPALGDTVVVALERGTRRLPRCLGVIQSTGYITAGDD